jgi:hypothetical protein
VAPSLRSAQRPRGAGVLREGHRGEKQFPPLRPTDSADHMAHFASIEAPARRTLRVRKQGRDGLPAGHRDGVRYGAGVSSPHLRSGAGVGRPRRPLGAPYRHASGLWNVPFESLSPAGN